MKSRNRILLIILCMLMVFSNVLVSAAEPAPIRVFLNGTEIAFDQPPVIENGRTLVPARAILEALGLTLAFDESTGTVTAENAQTAIVMTLGSTAVTVNQEEMIIDAPAKILGGRTLVPLRFIGETMNLTVDWDESARTIKLDDKTPPAPEPIPAPKPAPTPEPEPASYYHMSDEDIKAAIEESKKGWEHFYKNVNNQYVQEKKQSDSGREYRDSLPYLVVTPYFAIVKNAYVRKDITTYDAYEYEDWKTEWEDRSGLASGDEYFKEMKELYETEFDSGNKIYIYILDATTRSTVWDIFVIQKINKQEISVPFAEMRDNQHTFDVPQQFERISQSAQRREKQQEYEMMDIYLPWQEGDELYRTKLAIDIRDIDPDVPLEVRYKETKMVLKRYWQEKYQLRSYEAEETYNRTMTIDLSKYK